MSARPLFFFCLLALGLLSACGGGSDATVAVPVAEAIAADRISYGQATQFTLTGSRLAGAASVAVSRCDDLETSPDVTQTSKVVTCTIKAVGADAVTVSVRDASGALLLSQAFSVPKPQVSLQTNLGTLVVELAPAQAPVSVDNFLRYVHSGFYKDTVFHRVVTGFVAQGGWINRSPAIQPGQFPPIVLESANGLRNLRGTLGMARTEELNSATSQFYFNLVDNPSLDYASDTNPGYAVFGALVSGVDVLDAIGKTPVASKYGLPAYPVTDIVIESATQTR